MENQEYQPENQSSGQQGQSQGSQKRESPYGASYQNDENDSSKEENEFKEEKSNTFGQTTTDSTRGHGDQEDEIANQGDGSGSENQFEDEDFDEDTFEEDNEDSNLEERGDNGL